MCKVLFLEQASASDRYKKDDCSKIGQYKEKMLKTKIEFIKFYDE